MRRGMAIVAAGVLIAGMTAHPIRGQAGGSQGPATPQAPTHDVKVELDDLWTGATTFVVDKAGKVSGAMHLNHPDVVDAALGGTVKEGVWTFEYSFSMYSPACTGTSSGTAKVSPDQASVTGTLTVTGGCSSRPQTGAFAFTKRAK